MSYRDRFEAVGNKGGKLISAIRDAKAYYNTKKTYYEALKVSAGGSLANITDVEINAYYGFDLPPAMCDEIRIDCEFFGALMELIKSKIDNLPADDVS